MFKTPEFSKIAEKKTFQQFSQKFIKLKGNPSRLVIGIHQKVAFKFPLEIIKKND